VLYVKPLFLRSKSRGVAPIPELKKVVLATADNEIVVADTYAQALSKLFGAAEPVRATPTISEPSGERPVISLDKAGAREALELARQAEAALRAGDFAKYGDLQNKLKAKLEALAK